MGDDPDAPFRLDYGKREHEPFWPANPLSIPGAIGMAVGLPVPVVFVLWSHWAENVIRVPRLWYQQEFLVPVTMLLLTICIPVSCFWPRWRFSVGLLIGALVSVGLLTINHMIRAMFRHHGIAFY